MEAGIYFLIKNNKVVYVGKTLVWPIRLKWHIQQLMDFDTTKFLKYPYNELDKWERAYIKKYNPPENKRLKQSQDIDNRYQYLNPKTQYGKNQINKRRRMKFRKLTEKSYLGIGTYKDVRVGRIIELDKKHHLISIYFKCSHITFFDDVLESIGITEQWRIPKPGIDIDLYYKFTAENGAVGLDQYKDKQIYNKAKSKLKRLKNISNSKSMLMNNNRKYC